MSKRVPKPDQKKVDALIKKATKTKGYSVCGYWKRSGGVCLRPRMAGRKRCATPSHGGKAKRGAEAPGYKHGRSPRVKRVVPRLMERFEKADSDPQLLSMRTEIRYIDVSLWEMIEEADELGIIELFKEMRRLRKIAIGYASGDEPDMEAFTRTVNAVFELIDRGSSEWDRIEKIFLFVEQKKKLVESERKAMIDMRLAISVEQLAAYTAETLDIIYANVSDVKTIVAIEDAFEHRLLEQHNGEDSSGT